MSLTTEEELEGISSYSDGRVADLAREMLLVRRAMRSWTEMARQIVRRHLVEWLLAHGWVRDDVDYGSSEEPFSRDTCIVWLPDDDVDYYHESVCDTLRRIEKLTEFSAAMIVADILSGYSPWCRSG